MRQITNEQKQQKQLQKKNTPRCRRTAAQVLQRAIERTGEVERAKNWERERARRARERVCMRQQKPVLHRHRHRDRHLHACKHKPPPQTTTQRTHSHSLSLTCDESEERRRCCCCRRRRRRRSWSRSSQRAHEWGLSDAAAAAAAEADSRLRCWLSWVLVCFQFAGIAGAHGPRRRCVRIECVVAAQQPSVKCMREFYFCSLAKYTYIYTNWKLSCKAHAKMYNQNCRMSNVKRGSTMCHN